MIWQCGDDVHILSCTLRPSTAAIPDSQLAVPGRLSASGIKLTVLGIFGPIEGTKEAMQLSLEDEHPLFHQSVSFVVAEKPAAGIKPWQELPDEEVTMALLPANAGLRVLSKDSSSMHHRRNPQ